MKKLLLALILLTTPAYAEYNGPVNGQVLGTPNCVDTGGQHLNYNSTTGVFSCGTSSAGTGDVVGPASATANAIPTYSGTTGKLIQNNSGVTIASDVITAGSINVTSSSAPAYGPYRASGNAVSISVNSSKNATFASGRGLIVGGSSESLTNSSTGTAPVLQTQGLSQRDGSTENNLWSNDALGAQHNFFKSRGTFVFGQTVVQNNDSLGDQFWDGSDGTGPIRAGQISVFVDGTPGTNDMPGRMVFSTTRDGAAAVSTALTIDNKQLASFTGGIASTGTKFTTSGCSVSATTGGATAGTYTSGTTGACTVVITMNGATGATAANGWSCYASNRTTPGNLITQTASSATTATMSGTTASGDVISFACIGY